MFKTYFLNYIILGCSEYEVLDDNTRNVGYNYNTYGTTAKCDNDGHGNESPDWAGDNKWYRFQDPAGTKMIDYSPGTYGPCATHFPIWLNGAHPNNLGETVERTACVQSTSSTCDDRYSTQIQVRNCGQYFLYLLKNTKGCNFRYCAK